MEGSPPRRRRRLLTDEERAAMAAARFSPDKTGHIPTLEELGQRFDRPPSVVQYAVSHAVEEGLVHVRVVPAPLPRWVRDDAIEHALEDRYPALRRAIVVRPPRGGDPVKREASYEHVGWHLASYIGATPELLLSPPGGLFAVGGGRGAYFTVKGLRAFSRGSWPPMVIGSLYGSVGEDEVHRLPGDLGTQCLDPDPIAIELCGCFASGTRLRLVTARLTPLDSTTPDAAGRFLNSDACWFSSLTRPRGSVGSRRASALATPVGSIIGVGDILDYARLGDALEGEWKPRPFRLSDEVLKLLREIWRLATRLATKSYSPVYDLGFRMAVVAPRERRPSAAEEKLLASARKLADQVNRLTVHTPEAVLDRMPQLYLPVVGATKSAALESILRKRERLSPSGSVTLATDSTTATALLNPSMEAN